jgi:hypothetical protein
MITWSTSTYSRYLWDGWKSFQSNFNRVKTIIRLDAQEILLPVEFQCLFLVHKNRPFGY